MKMQIRTIANAWYVSPRQGVSFTAAIHCTIYHDFPWTMTDGSDQAAELIEPYLCERILQPLTQIASLDDPDTRYAALEAALLVLADAFPDPVQLYLISCEPGPPCHGAADDAAAGWQLACGLAEIEQISPFFPDPSTPLFTGRPGDGKDAGFHALLDAYSASQAAESDEPEKKPGLIRRLLNKLRNLRRRKNDHWMPCMSMRSDLDGRYASAMQDTQPMQPISDGAFAHRDESVQGSIRRHQSAPAVGMPAVDWRADTLPSALLRDDMVAAHAPVDDEEWAPPPIPFMAADSTPAPPEELREALSPFRDAEDNAELSRLFAEEEDDEEPPRKCAAPSGYTASWRHSTLAPYNGPDAELPVTGAEEYPTVTDAPLCTTDVQFTAAAPTAVKPGDAFQLDVLMYTEAFRDRAMAMIAQTIRDASMYESGFYAMAMNQGVRVMLESEDIGFSETSRELVWNGKLSRFSFQPAVPANYRKPQIRLTATLIVDGLSLLDLKLLVQVNQIPQPVEVERCKPRSVFISYAHRDTFEVHKRLQGMYAMVPDLDVFIDWLRLRRGDFWEDRIKKEILQRDQFFLFWSKNARKSAAVNDEWHYALQHKGLKAIVPMPLAMPAECPPPQELSSLHFCDWTMAYSHACKLAETRRRRFLRW